MQKHNSTTNKTETKSKISNQTTMQNAKFKTQYNAHLFPKNYEENNLPSATIPDQSLSVKDILQRYANGLPLGGAKVPVYNGEDYIPDLDRLDLAERAALIESNAQRILEMQKDLQRRRNPKPKPVEQPAPKDNPGAAPSAGAGASA